MCNTWGDLRAAIDSLEDDEKENLKSHFNGLIEDEGTLGDILFGDADEFEQTMEMLSDDIKKEYTDELMEQEVVDKAELEASITD